MCGRFAFYSPREAVSELFEVEFPLALEPRFNIAPTQFVVTLRQKEGESDRYSIEPVLLRWGLIPFWAKDPRIGNRLINARAESVDQKPAFRAAFRRRRCVILANGYYEWQRTDAGKVPYFISARDEQPFAMAGLWERWHDGGSSIETCTIITTAANSCTAELHHRMPAILSVDDTRGWLDHANESRENLLSFLRPAHEDLLRCWTVSTAVNNARNEGPELIEAR